MELHINLKVEKNCKGRWRLNSSILQDEQFVSTLKEDINYFLEINVGSANRLATVWDALKAFVRGKCLAFSSKKVEENKVKIQTLEERIGTVLWKNK